MTDQKEHYDILLAEAKADPQVLGFILGGARGKDLLFITEHSDYDVTVVLTDDAPLELKKQYERFASPLFDIRARTLSEFRRYAAWGTAFSWDRYNFTHVTPVLDKTGEVTEIIIEKGILPPDVQHAFVADALDSYINSVYRSAKYWRDKNEFAALLDGSESLPYLMDALYGLEGRVKPYNKYFEWELRNHPLAVLPWSVEEFVGYYKSTLTTADLEVQKKVFLTLRDIFVERGYAETFDGWKGKYFVG